MTQVQDYHIATGWSEDICETQREQNNGTAKVSHKQVSFYLNCEVRDEFTL